MNVYHITYTPNLKSVCLFFLECNFSCRGCIRTTSTTDIHLKKSLKSSKKKRRSLSLEEILNYLYPLNPAKIIFLGGEPTIDPEFNILAKTLKEELKTYNVLITNGKLLADLVFLDEICVSIKTVDTVLHREFTGVSNEKVLSNFRHLSKEKDIILRSESILIPGYIDVREIEETAKFISECNPKIPYRIDGFIPSPSVPWKAPTEEELVKATDVARRYLEHVSYLSKKTPLKHEVIEIV